MKKIIVAFIVLVGGLSAVLYVELQGQQAALEGPAGGSGTIEGSEVDVVARIPARIDALHADEGDQVSAGQVLVELDCREQQAARAQAAAAVEAARAQIEAAKATVKLAEQGVEGAKLKTQAAQKAARATSAQKLPVKVQRDAAKRMASRVATLAESGGATEQDLDRSRTEADAARRRLQVLGASAAAAQAQAQAVEAGERAAQLQVDQAKAGLTAAQRGLDQAEAALRRAEVAVSECRLPAPRGGRVSVRAFEPGEVVMPGAKVFTIVDISTVEATFYLPNAELASVEPGAAVTLVADAYPDRRFSGTVARVASEAEFTPRNVQTREDRDRLVYAVDVTVPNADGALRPGMPVEIRVDGTSRRTAKAER